MQFFFQASLQGATTSPSVTGFFSPTSEEATSLASSIIHSPSPALSGLANIPSSPSPPSAASVRYDLPKSPTPPSHVTELLQPVETRHQQGDQQPIVDEDEDDGGEERERDGGEVAARSGVSYSRQQTREDTSSLALNIQPKEVIVDKNSDGAPDEEEAVGVQPQESMAAGMQESGVGGQEETPDHSDGESCQTRVIDTCSDSAEMEPKLEETSSAEEGRGQGERSLQEEMQEVEGGAARSAGNVVGVQESSTENWERSAAGAGRREDDYVAQEEVESYLVRMKQEGENYVDQNQVEIALHPFSNVFSS